MFGKEITIGDGLTISLVAMTIVFLILLIIMGCLQLFVYVGKLQADKVVEDVKPKTQKPVQKLDLNDEDMVVACLVATIEANKEYGSNMRVVNVKRI